MCEPTTIAVMSLALATASAGAQYENTRKTASQTADNANRAAESAQADLNRQQQQTDAATAQQMNEAARKAQKDSALFDVVAGEYGGGNSVDRARTIGNLQTNENLATMTSNARTGAAENGFSQLATIAQAKARLAAINQPSMLGTALQIGGAATSAYAGYANAQATKKAPIPS